MITSLEEGLHVSTRKYPTSLLHISLLGDVRLDPSLDLEQAERLGKWHIFLLQHPHADICYGKQHSLLQHWSSVGTYRYRHPCRHHQLPLPTGENRGIQPGPSSGAWIQPTQGHESFSKLSPRHNSWVVTGSGPGAEGWCPDVEETSGGLERPTSWPEWTRHHDWTA